MVSIESGALRIPLLFRNFTDYQGFGAANFSVGVGRHEDMRRVYFEFEKCAVRPIFSKIQRPLLSADVDSSSAGIRFRIIDILLDGFSDSVFELLVVIGDKFPVDFSHGLVPAHFSVLFRFGRIELLERFERRLDAFRLDDVGVRNSRRASSELMDDVRVE